jgi:tetratricopeptide (TPR) repeat protein
MVGGSRLSGLAPSFERERPAPRKNTLHNWRLVMNAIVSNRRVWFAVAITCCFAASARARYMRPDLVDTPIDRLVTNLEKLAEESPEDVQVRFNLARLHAMAFALKTDTTKFQRGQEKRGAWFGYEPKYIPFENKPTDDPEQLKDAEAQLEKAIARYAEAIKLNPNHLPSRLGHAWCIEQSGKKEQAIEEYRKLIEDAWEKEGKKRFAGLGGHFITAETSSYLIPLLDATTDAAEIKTLQDRVKFLKSLPRPVTPIAIPLTDKLAAEQMVDRNAAVHFDADGSGERNAWTWIHQDAGWLVHDPRHTGRITSALQMFGNVSFWLFWDNGYQPLAALDDDNDSWLRGEELAGLAIWQDANQNGVSEPGEVKELTKFGIVGLNCSHRRFEGDPEGMVYSPAGVLFEDGTTRPSYDVILRKATE